MLQEVRIFVKYAIMRVLKEESLQSQFLKERKKGDSTRFEFLDKTDVPKSLSRTNFRLIKLF